MSPLSLAQKETVKKSKASAVTMFESWLTDIKGSTQAETKKGKRGNNTWDIFTTPSNNISPQGTAARKMLLLSPVVEKCSIFFLDSCISAILFYFKICSSAYVLACVLLAEAPERDSRDKTKRDVSVEDEEDGHDTRREDKLIKVWRRDKHATMLPVTSNENNLNSEKKNLKQH